MGIVNAGMLEVYEQIPKRPVGKSGGCLIKSPPGFY